MRPAVHIDIQFATVAVLTKEKIPMVRRCLITVTFDFALLNLNSYAWLTPLLHCIGLLACIFFYLYNKRSRYILERF